ncbi:anti-sigma-K factor RskA [Novosphingobium sp. PhB55]|uniref:anti-sigma factor n=1 Tax=unclassified Novosphingobium TaxID=2644732 RepID=UPI001064A66F|nr:anti-sigma factor [Novosphingobium sp. PhB55]TDW64394.1 anti-sigma-K factor RskA [Novosphingobium sp. PhB55]
MVEMPEDQDRDGLAAELALGLLDGADRAAALRLCLSDPAFARRVEQWQLRLSPMLAAVPAAEPSSTVWNAIAARIGAPVAAAPRGLRAWRAAALGAGALAASLALFVAMRPAPTVPDGSMAVSQMSGVEGGAIMAVAFDPRRGVLRFDAGSPTGTGKSPELWVIPKDGVPRSLGLIQAGSAEMPVADPMRPFLKTGATLAITMEDPATAPHQAPSAAPVMTGKISEI